MDTGRRGQGRLVLSYILPLRAERPRPDLTDYLRRLSECADVIVVDGSSTDLFDLHHRWWGGCIRHVPVDPAHRTPMGKVGGVLTGLDHARSPAMVVADDDVRFSATELLRLEQLLDLADVVRPQNVFTTWPWHAWWDTGRALIARATGGDWPGTMAVRCDVLRQAGGYAGDVMFENLELVRTVQAAGGRELVALDLVVRREPPTASHFFRQRVRQAYDELARPVRLAVQLALLPSAILGGRRAVVAILVGSLVLAELGRRRAGGRAHYPAHTALAAPAWVAERAITSWLAIGCHLFRGGIRYGDVRLARAASSRRVIAAARSPVGAVRGRARFEAVKRG
jgi:hypothetical protein